MDDTNVLIIGAGATGLMAAHTLAKAGKKVTVLEARDRCGGRIHTMPDRPVLKNAELGAEFVHGDLPVTLALLKEAGIAPCPAGGEMWHYKNGSFVQENEQIEGYDVLMDKLQELEEDITIEEFLKKAFPGERYQVLRHSVRGFVSGYDSADPARASAFALRNEWQSEDDGAQHRVNGGYATMISYLEEEVKAAGGQIRLNTVVKEVHWQKGNVKVVTADGDTCQAQRVIIALPLGILQAGGEEIAAISFAPPIPKQQKAIDELGFGAIIKVLLEFDTPFWEEERSQAGRDIKNMWFLLSDEEIPTWWTQIPKHSHVLTGWLGGPGAAAKKYTTDEDLLAQALLSLSNIFKVSIDELKNKLTGSAVMNWTKDPFTLGSYAYDTVAAPASRALLGEAVESTLFFAGEYLYEGTAMGTVEAALTSGQEAAKKILEGLG